MVVEVILQCFETELGQISIHVVKLSHRIIYSQIMQHKQKQTTNYYTVALTTTTKPRHTYLPSHLYPNNPKTHRNTNNQPL